MTLGHYVRIYIYINYHLEKESIRSFKSFKPNNLGNYLMGYM